ncbi:MAG TPA: phytanoyl-CoA dioxygenase family protein [Acidimicrobiales bacterium]|nr:phytanoyl-CoA dioxygenase family protein [Acidimicrobiales bacterium]
MLTADQVDAFTHDGIVVLPDLFTEAELEAFRAEADAIALLSVGATVALGKRHPRLDAKLHHDGRLTLRKVQPVNDLSPLLASIAFDERLIAPIRQLIGDEPVLMEEKLNYKQTLDTQHLDLSGIANSALMRSPGSGIEGFALHHDWGYYRQQGYPEDTLSSAVTIDDCAGRGPIRVALGSHSRDVELADPDPASGLGIVAPGQFGEDDLTEINATAGSVLVFHSKLVHDSLPNPTESPRRLMIYSHYPKSFGGDDADRRNGGTRAYAQEFEHRYRQMVAAGEAQELRWADVSQPASAHLDVSR